MIYSRFWQETGKVPIINVLRPWPITKGYNALYTRLGQHTVGDQPIKGDDFHGDRPHIWGSRLVHFLGTY